MRSRLKYGLHSGRCVKLHDGYAAFGAYFEAARLDPFAACAARGLSNDLP